MLDGLDVDIDIRLGDERLAIRLAAAGLVPQTAVDGVLEDLKAHLGGVVPSDDLTLLALGT